MATVYKAHDTRLERDVAIKVIRKETFPATQHELMLKRFEREAKALARLSHPNIVKIHDYGEFEGAPYLVMEYLPGGTLKQKLGKPIPWQDALRLLIPVARALDYAHRQSMVHRDVKPSNIITTADGDPMLADFGIAKILENTDAQTLTGTGAAVGTPEYMAPEQWTGQAGPSADIYSLGAVCYELISGRKPYTADTPAAVLLKQATEPIPRPRQFVRDLPEEVENLLLKALAKNPEDRYLDMVGLATAMETLLSVGERARKMVGNDKSTNQQEVTIDEIASDQGKQPDSASTPRKNGEPHRDIPPKRRRGRWVFGGVALLLVIGIIMLVVWQSIKGIAGDSGKIAFVSSRNGNNGIYIMDPDGKNPTRLTINSIEVVGSPAISPDGMKIAFQSDRDGNNEIYVMNADGTNQRRLTDNSVDDSAPAWSPDGTKIAYVSDLLIRVMYADGTDSINLTEENLYLNYSDLSPTWSPDGKKIAFVSSRTGNNAIYVMNADGTGLRQLTDNSTINGNPAWSPDGSKIIFESYRDGNGEIYIMNVNGTGQTRLTNNPGQDSNPAWSPDGMKIAFSSTRDGNYEIYIMNADGSHPINITNDLGDDSSPSWAP